MKRSTVPLAAIERRRIRTPVLAVTAGAWAAIVVLAALDRGGHVAAAHHHGPAPGGGAGGAGGIGTAVLMFVGMMAPLTIAPLRAIRQRVLPDRRRSAGWAFAGGYALAWSAALAALAGVARLADASAVRSPATWVLAVGIALAWNCTPAKQACLNRTHAHHAIVRAAGRRVPDAVRAGAVHAAWCVGSCWALMLAPLLVGHDLVAMVAATVWVWTERVETPRRPTWRFFVPQRIAKAAWHRVRAVSRLRQRPLPA